VGQYFIIHVQYLHDNWKVYYTAEVMCITCDKRGRTLNQNKNKISNNFVTEQGVNVFFRPPFKFTEFSFAQIVLKQ
jgi:hypothetical protein